MSGKNRGRGKRRRPDYARIARLERELGIGDAAKAVNPAITARTGRPNTPVMVPLTEVINAMTARRPAAHASAALPRDPDDEAPFGPRHPMHPAPLDAPRRDTGRPEPRLSEFETGWNLPGSDYRLLPWKVLREAARGVDILRRCVEVRKRHVVSLDWAWTVSDDAVEQALASKRGAARIDVEAELREQMASEIARLTAFWRKPWRANNLDFKLWASMLLEEHLVIDAVAVYPEMTYGGDCLNMEIVSGDTIKVLRDWRGALPRAPYPAYQQVLYGFPRGEFTATVEETPDGKVAPGAFQADQLYYYRGTPFASTPYGLSAVEQALISARLYLKRQGWLLSEYDDGVTPNTWMVPPENASEALDEPFTVLKRREWEQALNDELAGNTALRHRVKLTPPGFKPQQMSTTAEQYKPDYDFFLIRILAAHMDVTLPEINITEPGGLGASGYHEGQEDVQNRIGTRPTVATIQDIVNDLSHQFLHAPPQLEFKMLGLESEDEAAADAIADTRVKSGRMTLNEDRDRQGMPRYNFPEADMPQVQLSRGIIFLEGASQLAPPGEAISPAQGPAQGPQGQHAGQPDGSPPGARDDTEQGAPEDDAAVSGAQKNAEAAAFKRWSTRRGDARKGPRPFEFQHLTPLEAFARGLLQAQDVGTAAIFKAADADPKAGPADWPGWQVDLNAADYWAPLLAAALVAAIDTHALAQAWQAQQQAPVAAPPTSNAAAAWLTAAGITTAAFTASLTPLLARLLADGWLIGSRSAQSVASGTGVDWDGWEPGLDATRNEVAYLSGYRRLLLDSGITINSIAQTRLDDLAAILADAAANDLSAADIEERIRALLTDPAQAHTVAITELNRASSAAAHDTYRALGIGASIWVTEPGACPICLGNAKAGALPLGQSFPSGDPFPPAHPRCRCWPMTAH